MGESLFLAACHDYVLFCIDVINVFYVFYSGHVFYVFNVFYFFHVFYFKKTLSKANNAYAKIQRETLLEKKTTLNFSTTIPLKTRRHES